MRRQSRDEAAKLIDFKQGILNYDVKTPRPIQDLSWLTQQLQNQMAKTELPPPPPPKKKKDNRSEFEKRIISQRTAGKGFLRNHQLGKVSKKDWDLDLVINFLKDGHLDAELRTFIRLNHNFYRFVYSSVINVIYFNTKEVHIQERFVL